MDKNLLPREWKLLRENWQFRRLFLAAFVSSFGDWFNSIAVLVVVLQLTDSSTAVGLTLAMRVFPYLVAGPLGGVWSDRVRRTRIMIGSDLARALLALGFLAVTQASQVGLVYVLTALMVVFSALFVPARAAYITGIVKKGSLGQANALLAGSNGVVMVIGFSLGGLITAHFGAQAAFLLNAVSFLISAWLLWKGERVEKQSSAEQGAAPSFRLELVAGIRSITANKPVLWLFLLEGGWSIGGGAINVLVSVMAHQVFGGGSTGVGLSYASLGAGTIVGSMLAAKCFKDDKQRMQTTAGLSFVADSLFHILFANSWSPLFTNLSLVGAGLAGAIGNSVIMTHIASSTDTRVQGRVFSIFNTVGSSLLAFSMMAAGLLTDQIGAALLGTIGGAVILLFSVCYLVLVLLKTNREGSGSECHATGSSRKFS